MNDLTKQWINVLFNEDEHTCMGTMWENKTFPVKKLEAEQEEYVSINPMKKGTTRKGINVIAFRNFLFEMDEFNKKDQANIMKQSGLPISAVTDSGNKSIHFILSLEVPLEDRTQYTAWFKCIRETLVKYGAVIDPACKDPGRFTRAPFGTRSSNGATQKVYKVKHRISRKEMEDWFEKEGVDPNDWIELPTTKQDTKGHSNALHADKIDWVLKYYMSKQPQYEEGNYNYQFTMACQLLRTGMSAAAIKEYYKERFNHIHENDPIKGAEATVKPGEEIYVPTMEERKEYYRRLDESETLMHARSGYNRPELKEAVEAKPEDLHRYIAVGTEYFKIESMTDKLIPWSRSMFEKLYGTRAIPSLMYDKFGYKPDYTSEAFTYSMDADLKTRNMFIRPSWKAQPGAFPTIEAALRHAFKGQYDKILEYSAVSICFPEAKLPVLWFLGPEGKGKSAIVAIFRLLVGEENYKKISGKQLESDFTDFLAAKQLVVVEEAGNWKNPANTMANIKDWVTEISKQVVNPKYGKQFEAPIHAKFIFTSNDYDSIPEMGEGSRFWIIELKDAPAQKVSDYYGAIAREMGHFVHHLITQIKPQLRMDLYEPHKLDTTHRLYFQPEEYETDIKRWVKDTNRTPLEDAIDDVFSDWFEKWPAEHECYFDLKSLIEALPHSVNPGKKELKIVLRTKMGLEPSNPLSRPDSLRWDHRKKHEQPQRLSQWFKVDRSKYIDQAIFSSETQFA